MPMCSLPAGGKANPTGGIEPACFRVGLEQQDMKVPVDYSEDCTKSMKNQIEDEFIDRFPDINYSLIFVPSSIWVGMKS